ncbi:tRNA pseudouridine(55) synthase TruB [Patescibacteria group bacterium]
MIIAILSSSMEKILVVDKPIGKTSHDMVALYRKKLGIKKIGHAGTLDPFASGVLILLIGKATKRFEEFMDLEKEYEMEIELGWSTDTLDLTGKIVKKLSSQEISNIKLTEEKIKKAVLSFKGEYIQDVPIFSAVKLRGKPLYKYARKGIRTIIPKRKVNIYKIKLVSIKLNQVKYPKVKINVVCSTGTYLRSLALDIGECLNIPSTAVALKRLRVGDFKLG